MTKRSELNFPAIYTITHTASGKTYVGQTINVRIRWQLHRSDLRKGKHRNCYLQNAWHKYGKDAFVFVVHTDLRHIAQEQLADALNRVEVDVLASFPETYNLMIAGDSGTTASPETRALLSAQRLVLWKDPAHRAKQKASIAALYADPEWKSARDAAVKEAKNTAESKAAVSAHFSALWQTEEHRANQSAKRAANWQDPDYRSKQSASRSATWNNPEVRAKRIAGLVAAHARRRAGKSDSVLG